MAIYRWITSSGSFGISSNWANTTLKIDPARIPPGLNDTAQFFTSGGTITGSGSVGGLAFQGTLGVPWSIAAQLRSASSLVGGATELVSGGTWNAGTLSVVSGGRLSVLDGGALQAGSIALAGSTVLGVNGTGSAVVGGGVAAAGVLTVASSLTGAGTVSATGGIVDDGVVAASGGTLRLASSVSGGGSLLIGDGATLSLGGLSAVGVTFTGPGGTLEVSSLSVGGTLVLSEGAVIIGFAPGETIRDADGTPVTGAVYTALGAGLGTLTLLNGNTPLGVLTLAGTFDGYDFGVVQNGSGGTDITLTAQVQTPAPTPVPVPAADPAPPVLDVTPPAPDPVPVPVADPAPPVLDATPPSPDPVPVPVADPAPPVLNATPPAPDPVPVPVADPAPPVLDVTPPAPDPVLTGIPAPVADPACNAENHLERNSHMEASREDSLLHHISDGQGEWRMAFLTENTPGGAARLDPQLGATMRLAGLETPEHAAFTGDHGNWQIGLNPSGQCGTTFCLIHNPDTAGTGANLLLRDLA